MRKQDAQLAHAQALFEEGDLEGALEQTRQLIAQDAHRPDFWSLEGQIRLSLGEIQAAARSFDRACQIAPGLAAPLLQKARFLNYTDHFEEALRLSEQALQYTEQPQDRRDAYLIQAESLVYTARQQMMDLAEEMEMAEEEGYLDAEHHHHDTPLDESLPLTPEIEDTLRRALTLCQQALDLDAELPELWYLKAGALIYLKRFEEAAAALRKTVELDPAQPEYWNELGICLERLEDHESAKEVYLRLYELETAPDADPLEFTAESFTSIANAACQDVEADFMDATGQTLPQITVITKDFPERSLFDEPQDGQAFNPWHCLFRIELHEHDENSELKVYLYQRNVEREVDSDDPDELYHYVQHLIAEMIDEVFYHSHEDDEPMEA